MVLETILHNIKKNIILRRFLAKRLLEMATPEVQGDQKLFYRVYYILKLKVTNFQFPTLDGF